MLAKALALAAVFTGALALPNVTEQVLPAGCASYPGYDAATDIAGPWTVWLKNPDNADLDRFGGSVHYSVSYDPNSGLGPQMRWGYLTINPVLPMARSVLRCSANELQVYTQTALNRAGAPINYAWTTLGLSPYPYDASLLYLIPSLAQPSLYEHYQGESKQDGWFLGGYNTTTWAVKWYAADQGSWGQPYFYLRLLPEGQSLKANETKTFLQIQLP